MRRRPNVDGREARLHAAGYALAFALLVLFVGSRFERPAADAPPPITVFEMDDHPSREPGSDPNQRCLTTTSAAHPEYLRVDHEDEVRVTVRSDARLAGVTDEECRAALRATLEHATLTGVSIAIEPDGRVAHPDGSLEWSWRVRPPHEGYGHLLFRLEPGRPALPLMFDVRSDAPRSTWVSLAKKAFVPLFAFVLAWIGMTVLIRHRWGLRRGE